MLANIVFNMTSFNNDYGVTYTKKNNTIIGTCDCKHPSWENYYDEDTVLDYFEEYKPGIFITSNFNFNYTIDDNSNYTCIDGYFNLDQDTGAFSTGFSTYNSLSTYGVCDNVEQVLVYLEPALNNKDDEYCIILTPVYRKDQSPEGGWRYHKWGQYIGSQNPQSEYLYDDEHIDLVYCFSIVKVTNDNQ